MVVDNAMFLLLSSNGYVAIDTETTGLNRATEKLVEVSAVRKVPGKEIETFSTLINPGKPIPPETIAVHHITDEMVCGKPDAAEALDKLYEFVGDLPMVAHNAPFDMAFIVRQDPRFLTVPCGDSLSMARKLWPQLRHHRLSVMLEILGSPYVNSHRALDDAFGVTSIVDAALPMLQKAEAPRLTLLAIENYIITHLPCMRMDVTTSFPEITGVTITSIARRMEQEKKIRIKKNGRLVCYLPFEEE